jgi:hypothetical protein
VLVLKVDFLLWHHSLFASSVMTLIELVRALLFCEVSSAQPLPHVPSAQKLGRKDAPLLVPMHDI